MDASVSGPGGATVAPSPSAINRTELLDPEYWLLGAGGVVE